MASADEWREREVVAAADDGERRGFFSLAWSSNGKWLAYVREEMMKKSRHLKIAMPASDAF
jgi:hypothetical protein